jgi:transposase
MAVRTSALRGHTPVLRVKLTRDHLSAIGGITPKGRIFMQMQTRAYTAEDVVRYLRVLLRKIAGPLLVIWDGSPIHRAEVIKQLLASPMGKRLHLERLPGYAPELNPQEQVWNLLKRRERKATCVVRIWLTWSESLFGPKNVFAIGEPSFSTVSLMLLMRFRCFSRSQ